jgi:hypothetical protein
MMPVLVKTCCSATTVYIITRNTENRYSNNHSQFPDDYSPFLTPSISLISHQDIPLYPRDIVGTFRMSHMSDVDSFRFDI